VVPSWHSTIINWDQTLSTTRPQLLNMFSIWPYILERCGIGILKNM
jgi:hypothetical protein